MQPAPMNPAYGMAPGYAPQPGYPPQMGAAPMGAIPYAMPMGAPMMPAGVVMAPGQMMMGVAPTFANVMDVCAKAKGLFIKEEVNLAEVVTGCTMEKNFRVSLWDPALGAVEVRKGRGAEVFRMKETSECCERMFCGAARGFEIALVPNQPTVATYAPGLLSRDTMWGHADAMVISRPFRCTLCCLNRPVVYMRHATAGRFATVVNPCTLCSYQFDIHGAAPEDGGIGTVNPTVKPGEKWYTVNGSVCQPGVWCFCPFGECARVRLQVYAGHDADLRTPIGEVARVYPGCCRAVATESDDFTVSFPQESDPLKRSSLISAVILMNYLFYEANKKDNNNHHSDN